jgi:RNA polymerase sigma factor (sigma-70 family)
MLEPFEEEQHPTATESKDALTLLELLPRIFRDGQAFEALCHLYATFLASRVLVFIQSKGYPREMENEVWPIVYTVFSTIWEKGEQRFFKPLAGDSPAVVARKFKAWLCRFAQFTCMTEAKRYLEARIYTLPIDNDIETPDELLNAVIDWLDGQDLLAKILKELTARDQQILKLYIVDDKKQTEIAQALGISNGAVKAAFYRLKQKCQHILTNMRAQQEKGGR